MMTMLLSVVKTTILSAILIHLVIQSPAYWSSRGAGGASSQPNLSMDMDMDDDSMDGSDSMFCKGMMYMTMSMDGFQFSLLKHKQGACLNYLTAAWKLSDASTFHGAMLYSFMLAFMTEGLTCFQTWIQRHIPRTGKFRKAVMGLIYALQQWMGYIIMMVTMMYSFELFASVILGIMAGHFFFPHPSPYLHDPRRRAQPARRFDATMSSFASQSFDGTEQMPLLNSQEEENPIRRRRR